MFLKKIIVLFLLSILTCTTTISYGQVLDFEQLSVKDGLPSTECYHVMQDKHGYIWVYSEFGIVKHNGERFTPTCLNIALKDQNAYALFQTNAGEIYFSNSFNKIFRIRNDSAISIKAIEIFTKNFTQPDDIIFQIVVDSNNDIYFSNYKASFCYRSATNKVETLKDTNDKGNQPLIYERINNHFFSRRSIFFQKKENEVQIIDKDIIIKSKIYVDSYYESRRLLKANGDYFISSSDFIYKIDKTGKVLSKEIKGIVNFVVDKKNKIWVLSKNGLVLLDDKFKIIANYLDGKIVSNICFDDKEGIWLCTIGEGIYYCKNKEEVAYSNTNLKQKEIFFIRNNTNDVYFSSIDGSCYKLDNRGIESIFDFNGKVFCGDIAKYKDGYLFSTKKGLFYKDENKNIEEIKDPNGLSGLYSNLIKVLNKTDYLMFGGTSVYYFKNNKFSHSCFVNYKIYCITASDKNHFLLGTRNGIYDYNYQTNAILEYNDFFADKFIMSLIYDKNGNLWVATRGDGLYIVSKDHKIAKYSNLPFFVVKDIDFFGTDGVVVSTNLGVFVNTYKDTKILQDWINVFNDEVNSLELLDQKLWIASRKGLYSMDFPSIKEDTDYPIIINSIYADSKKVLENSSELKYNENDLRFNFDFLNYRSKVKNFYFKLNGPTKLSGTISGTALQIQNLEPGSYRLDVFPFHGPVYTNKHFLSTTFVIQPAFWQTYWFKAFIFIMIVGISGCIVALYFNSKRKREKKSAEVNKLLAEYKLTALKAQINPHFISNSLSAIQLLIDSGKIDKANQYIAKFSLLIRYVLKYSDKSVSRLSDELKIIELNVDLEQLRFMNSFIFKMDIEDNIDMDEIFVPPLITQPFIENAIWHGLIPLKSRPPQLILKIRKKNDFLVISIIDNGIGRMNSEKNNSLANNSARESMGTTLIQNRIDNLNQLHNSKVAEVNIIDLLDVDSNISGTQVNIVLSIAALSKF